MIEVDVRRKLYIPQHILREAGAGIKTNPDGDVDLPGAPCLDFWYSPCQIFLRSSDLRALVNNGAAAATSGGVNPPVAFSRSSSRKMQRLEKKLG